MTTHTLLHSVVHNYSNLHLTQNHLAVLDKGLSFTIHQPFQLKDKLTLLTQYDSFGHSLRKSVMSNCSNQSTPSSVPTTTSQTFIYRSMRFLRNIPQKTLPPHFTVNNGIVENYLEHTKVDLDNYLVKQEGKNIKKVNVSKSDLRAIQELKRRDIVIKPADKNLGIAILNDKDYVSQCLLHLSSSTYARTESFPVDHLKRTIQNILIKFKEELSPHKRLYSYLQPNTKTRPPIFYGIPKVHKPLIEGIPPLRPIVSHSNSLLSKTALLLDHVLQSLAQSYPDFLNNSTELVKIIENITIPEDTILVTLDVKNLYPSIPQQEVLDIIHKEMFTKQELIIFDPNLMTHLLHANINNNYFMFAEVTFQQLEGTAMGAAFSPTVANIYMSVLLQKFLQSTSERPFLLKRYIDDIFIIWPKHQNLSSFLHNINEFHPSIKYTMDQSNTHINFLDLTIFKSKQFSETHQLSVKTYQKEHNLYQYLHFTSNHPKSTFRGIIIGEAIRYIRTNSFQEDYKEQIEKFKTRLIKRKYPISFINRILRSISYKNRDKYLETNTGQHHQAPLSPMFKCIRPPNFHKIRDIILYNFQQYNLSRYTSPPIFIFLKGKSLKDLLVNSKFKPSRDDYTRIIRSNTIDQHTRAINLPREENTRKPHPCNHPRCTTCQHFNTSTTFSSTSTKQTFQIHHSFTCSSMRVIYLITCTRCHKQYVGKTINTLRERVSQHRSSIKVNQARYISKHFNLEHHSLANLKVQIIDTVSSSNLSDLHQLEVYWIHKLKTLQPKGLNVDTENTPTHATITPTC